MPFVGTSLPRPDGFAKAAGEAHYADDFTLPDLHFGATVRSPHPHARIRRIDAPPGVTCVTARDIAGINGVQLLDDSWPILASEVARHVGEAVALVVAPDRIAARRAADAVRVEYEPLPAVLSIEDAESQPPLYELALDCGDVSPAFAAAPHAVQGEYRTGLQEHIYIECQGITAWFEPDGSVVAAGSMQCPYYVHKALVHALGLADDRVRVKATTVGGGFGGKEDYPSMIALHAALLSRACGHPVRIIYDRHEDIVGTTKRHPSRIRHRTAVARDGTLLAMEIDIAMDGGAYQTLSPVVLSRALLHAAGPYRCPSVRIRGRIVRTHTAPNGAFRGFGVPQAAFAIERHMDRIGRELRLDPYEIRARNVVDAGDRLPTGQVLDPTTSARECLERVVEKTNFRDKWRAARQAEAWQHVRHGVGLSLYFHGAGFTGAGEHRMRSPVTARIREDGRIEILTAMTDMGQGCAIVFPQIAADAGGLTFDDLIFAPPDTRDVPDSGPTVASRTTMIVGGGIARVTRELRDRVIAWWSRQQERRGACEVRDGAIHLDGTSVAAFRDAARAYRESGGAAEVTLRHEPPAWQMFDEKSYQGAAYPTYAWGADVVEVAVDPDTFETRVTAAAAVCEVGRAIHPTLCAGQIEGGTLQAIGYGLMEEVKMKDGRYLNDRLATYIIPTIKDAPRIDVELIEHPWEGGPFGAKGVGELPMDGAAPAVASAIENAIGISVDEIPVTPERLLQAASR